MSDTLAKPEIHSAWVWIAASGVMYVYGLLGLFALEVPGVDALISYIQSIHTSYIIIAAFLVILIEGIYAIGAVFPGSSFTLLLAAIAGLQSPGQFILVLIAIFSGWSVSSILNIVYARYIYKPESDTPEEKLSSHVWYTWFPAFRANYEVAEIARGVSVKNVLASTLLVKLIATIVVGAIAFIVPLFIDISQIDSKEGFLGVLLIATITLGIGLFKRKKITIYTV